MVMSVYYLIIIIIGSGTLYSKGRQLQKSIKSKNRNQITIDVFFLVLTLAIIALLIYLKKFLS